VAPSKKARKAKKKPRKPALKTAKKPAKKAAARTSSPRPGGTSGHDLAHAKRELIEAFRREYGKTLKVLRALPSDHAELRPHPRLKSARELANVFNIEASMLNRAFIGQPVFGGGGSPPAVPTELGMVIEQVERSGEDLDRIMQGMTERTLGETIQFPVGPGTMGDWTKQAFAWFILSDHIHHRGQFSVYLRIAGGRVPAIYGPSGDEPWR